MSLVFNGSALLEYSGTPVTAFPVTLFCWVKPANTSQVSGVIGYGEFGAGKELAALQVSSAMRAQTRDGSESNNALISDVDTAYRPVMVVFASASTRTVYYGEQTAVTDVWLNISDISTFNRLRLGNRAFDALSPFTGEISEAAIWSAALGEAEWTSLHGGAAPETVATASLVDAWDLKIQAASHIGVNGRVLTATGTTQGATHPISRGATDATGTGAPASITLSVPTGSATGTVGATNGTGTGTLQSIILTAPAGTATGTSAGSGTITTPVMKNNTGTVLANETGVIVNVYNASTGALIVQKTGQTSNASGIVTISDALIVPATTYAYEVVLTGSRRRLPTASAA